MREIKFRAWDGNTMNYFNTHKSGIQYSSGQLQVSTGWDSDDNPTYSGDSTSEIMQYTGLKDKNGKEIYEGDILKRRVFPDIAPLVLKEESKVEKIILVSFDIDEIWQGYQINEDDEVIGNIYEDPNLVK